MTSVLGDVCMALPASGQTLAKAALYCYGEIFAPSFMQKSCKSAIEVLGFYAAVRLKEFS